jgi:hypothetical protein
MKSVQIRSVADDAGGLTLILAFQSVPFRPINGFLNRNRRHSLAGEHRLFSLGADRNDIDGAANQLT